MRRRRAGCEVLLVPGASPQGESYIVGSFLHSVILTAAVDAVDCTGLAACETYRQLLFHPEITNGFRGVWAARSPNIRAKAISASRF